MVSLEARNHKSGEGKAALERVSHRIAALGRLYSMLGETNSVEEVDAASYLEALCRDLIESVQKENGTSITLETDFESEPLPVDHAIPLGLIVNELVTNAVKYAFPSKTRGTVVVTLKRIPGELRLTVADDGKGPILDAPILGSVAGWSIPLRDSSAARSRGRAATREPSCV